jgi:hypothetical protein
MELVMSFVKKENPSILVIWETQLDEVEVFKNTCYSNRGQTPSVNTHTTRSKINTLMFLHGKTPMGKHP